MTEIPNGDGKADGAKRYAHVAPKYLTDAVPWDDAVELAFQHRRAFQAARDIAIKVGIPEAFLPDVRYGALRVLEYPPGAVSNLHEDFDLFTLMLYRDQPDKFVSHGDDAGPGSPSPLDLIRRENAQAHLGQIGEEIGLGAATPHEVVASETTQHAIVYFSIPNHDAVLPSGITVRDWLNLRMARSRTEFKAYE